MASKYNIVFDVSVSDKSIGEIRSKVEKALEKKINIKEYSEFDGLAAITNDANQVVKYIGSFREGLESVGFIIDKDLKKIEKFNTVVGAALPNLKWFSGAVQTAKSGHNTESNIAEAKKHIKNMVDAFDAPTAKMLVHSIAGDSLGSFFKNDKEFNTFISEYVKSLVVQGDKVSDTYDNLKNTITQKRSELEKELSDTSHGGSGGTIQDVKGQFDKTRNDFYQAVSSMAENAGLSPDISSISGDIGDWIGEQVRDFNEKTDQLLSSMDQKEEKLRAEFLKFQQSVSGKSGNLSRKADSMDGTRLLEEFDAFVADKKLELSNSLSELGISDTDMQRVMSDAENKFQQVRSKLLGKIRITSGESSDAANQMDGVGEGIQRSAQNTSDAADQMHHASDQMRNAAENTRRAADDLEDARNQLNDGSDIGEPGAVWDTELQPEERKRIQSLIQQRVGDGYEVQSLSATRVFDEEGRYDSIAASVRLVNKELGITSDRMYTIYGITENTGDSLENVRMTSERFVQTFKNNRVDTFDVGAVQKNAQQRLAQTMAGLPDAVKMDDSVQKMYNELFKSTSGIANKGLLSSFNINLDTLKSKIQELQKQSGGDKFNPLVRMEKTVNELPAKFSRVSDAYDKLNAKNIKLSSGVGRLSDLYDVTKKSIEQAASTWSSNASADDKLASIRDAQQNISLFRQEVSAAKGSVEELFEAAYNKASQNIIDLDASGLSSLGEGLRKRISDQRILDGGTLSSESAQAIRAEIESYKQLYQEKLKEQNSYNKKIQASIRSTEAKTQKANGYDQQSLKYAQENLKARQQQVKTENLIAEAKQKGVISLSQEQNYYNQLNAAVQNQNATNTPDLNQYDKLVAKFNTLRDSLSNMKLAAGNDEQKNFWEEIEVRARRYVNTVEDAKRNLLDDPTLQNATMYKDASNNLESYISTINELISVYPKLVSIQGQFNPAALLSDANTMFVRGGRRDDMLPEIDAYKKDIDQLGNMILEIGQYDFSTGSIEAYVKEVQKVISAYERVRSAGKTLKDQTDAIFQRSQDITGYQSILQDYGAYMYKFGASISSNDMLFEKFFKFREQLNKPLENFTGPDQAKRTFEELQAAAKRCGVEVESVRKRVGDLIDRFSFAAVMASAIGYASRMMRQMYQNVIEVDTALVELKKVTDASDNSMNQFLDNASKRAKELGVTLSDLTNATAAFARMGYSIADSTVLGEQASIFRNVGDDVDSIDDATSIMISTMKAFGIEAENVSSIIDKLNEVSNTYAITSGGIGNALTRSASAAFSAGNTLDQTIAMITTANQVVQNPEVVGTTIRTLSLRLRGAKTELEEASLDTDGMATSVSSLRKEIAALTNVDGSGGFDILADSGSFKSTYDILLGIGKVWGQISDINQAALLELVAGKRAANSVAAILNNYEEMEAVLQTSTDSAGSASREYENWMDSVIARVEQVKASFQSLSKTVMGDNLVKFILNKIRQIVDIFDVLIDKLNFFKGTNWEQSGGLNFASALGGVFLASKNIGLFDTTKNDYGLNTGLGFMNWNSDAARIAESNRKMLDAQSSYLKDLVSQQKGYANILSGIQTSGMAFDLTKTSSQLGGVSDLMNTIYNTKDINAQIAAIDNWKSSQEGVIQTTEKMSGASKIASGALNVVKGVMNSFVNAGITMLASFLVQGFISLIDNWIHRQQKLVESAKQLRKEYDEMQSELDTLTEKIGELEEEKRKIGEPITLTDKADVETLDAEIERLKILQGIQQTNTENAQKDAESAAVKAVGTKTHVESSMGEIRANLSGIDIGVSAGDLDMVEQLEYYTKLLDFAKKQKSYWNNEVLKYESNPTSFEYYNASNQLSLYESDIQDAEEHIKSLTESLMEQREAMYGVTDEGRTMASRIDSAFEALYKVQNGDYSYKSLKFDEIISNKEFASEIANLRLMAKEGTLSAQTIDTQTMAYKGLVGALRQAGISTQEFTDELNAMYNVASSSDQMSGTILSYEEIKESADKSSESVSDFLSVLTSLSEKGIDAPEVADFAMQNQDFAKLLGQAEGDTNALIESVVDYLFNAKQNALDLIMEQEALYIARDGEAPGWMSGLVTAYKQSYEDMLSQLMVAMAGNGEFSSQTAEALVANVQSAVSSAMINAMQGKYDVGTLTFDQSAYESMLTQFPEIEEHLDKLKNGTMSWSEALSEVGANRLNKVLSGLKQSVGSVSADQKASIENTISYIEQAIKQGLLSTQDFGNSVFAAFNEDLTALHDAWVSLASDELSADDVTQLLDTFPELAQYVDATSNKFGSLSIGLREISKSRAAEYMESIKKAMENAPEDLQNSLQTILLLMAKLQSETWQVPDVSVTFSDISSKIQVMSSALEEQSDKGKISASTMEEMRSAGLSALYAVDDVTGAVTVSKVEFQKYAKAMAQAALAELELQKADLVSKFQNEANALNKTTNALMKYKAAALFAATDTGGYTPVDTGTAHENLLLSRAASALAEKSTKYQNIVDQMGIISQLINEIDSGAVFESSGKSSKSEWKAEIDDLWEYKQAVEEVQNAIDDASSRASILDERDYEARRAIINESISLYNQLQVAQQSQMSAGQKIIQENIKTLEKYGFQIEYTASTHSLLFKNYDLLKQYTGDVGEKINDLIEETKDLNSSNQDLAKSYYSNIKAIQDYKDELIDLIDAEIDASQSMIDLQTKISEVYMKCYEEGTEKYQAELAKQESYLQQSLALRAKQLQQYAQMGLAEDDERVISALMSYWTIQGEIIDMQIDAWEREVDAQREAHEARQKALEEQQDALQNIIDLTVDLIKKEKQDQIDAIEDQVDKYEEIVNAKKKALDLTKETADYEKELAKKTKSVSDLQNQIQKLSLDDSREAYAERMKLEEELASAQEELSEYQSDKSYELRSDALDDELSAYKDTRQKEIDALQEYLNQSGTLIQEAMNRIASGGENLYSQLISYNAVYGDGIGTDLVSSWEKATAAIQAYGSIQAALNASIPDFVAPSMPDFSTGIVAPDYSSMLNQYGQTQQTETDIINQMKANSAAWHAASEEERKRLHEENIRLAAKLGLDYTRDYNGSTGKWYRNGYPLYHKGLNAGYVGFPSLSLKDRERLAILKDRELVLNDGDISNIVSRLQQIPRLFQAIASGGTSVGATTVSVSVDAPFTFSGSGSDDMRKAFEEYQSGFASRVQNLFDNLFTQRGYNGRVALSALKV